MLIFIAHNGKTLELDVQPATRCATVAFCCVRGHLRCFLSTPCLVSWCILA